MNLYDLYFVECPTCREHTGNPVLCDMCVARRKEFYELKDKLEDNIRRADEDAEDNVSRRIREYHEIADDLERGKKKCLEKLDNINFELDKLKVMCKHHIICSDCKKYPCTCKDKKWGTGDAVCVICDTYFGYFCQDSPDHSCHYSDELDANGELLLHNGELISCADREYGDDRRRDECLFCHLPEERT